MRIARASGTEAERESTETLAFGLEQCSQCTACAGVSYRVDPHDVLSVPVPERETGMNAEGRATYEEVPLTRCVDEVLGAEGPEYKCPQCGCDVAATRHPNRPPDEDVLAFDCQHLGRDHRDRPGENELQNNAPSDDLMFDISVLTLHRHSRQATRVQPGGARTARSDGLHAGLMPDGVSRDDIDDSIAIPSSGPEPSAEQVGMLSDTGFSRVQLEAKRIMRCATRHVPPQVKTTAHSHTIVERCRARLEWLFSYPDDMCKDEQPVPISSSSAEAASRRHDGAAAAVSLQKSSDPF
ncbi:hypothetical protein EDB89DRAFT_2074631 [Lactarius sanguifluus]|nr:hypothetical protein EDB89DRAFT_2074631 [Lactarius sanguifluus]